MTGAEAPIETGTDARLVGHHAEMIRNHWLFGNSEILSDEGEPISAKDWERWSDAGIQKIGDLYDSYGDVDLDRIQVKLRDIGASEAEIQEGVDYLCRVVPREWKAVLWNRQFDPSDRSSTATRLTQMRVTRETKSSRRSPSQASQTRTPSHSELLKLGTGTIESEDARHSTRTRLLSGLHNSINCSGYGPIQAALRDVRDVTFEDYWCCLEVLASGCTRLQIPSWLVLWEKDRATCLASVFIACLHIRDWAPRSTATNFLGTSPRIACDASAMRNLQYARESLEGVLSGLEDEALKHVVKVLVVCAVVSQGKGAEIVGEVKTQLSSQPGLLALWQAYFAFNSSTLTATECLETAADQARNYDMPVLYPLALIATSFQEPRAPHNWRQNLLEQYQTWNERDSGERERAIFMFALYRACRWREIADITETNLPLSSHMETTFPWTQTSHSRMHWCTSTFRHCPLLAHSRASIAALGIAVTLITLALVCGTAWLIYLGLDSGDERVLLSYAALVGIFLSLGLCVALKAAKAPARRRDKGVRRTEASDIVQEAFEKGAVNYEMQRSSVGNPQKQQAMVQTV